MNLIIDIGNTFVKYAVFLEGKIIKVARSHNVDYNAIDVFSKDYNISRTIISSVRKTCKIDVKSPLLIFNHKTRIPIVNLYKTPETLGLDRLANMVGASSIFLNKNILVVDAGTCITYDLINENKQYLGGRISPGIQMRYDALNRYTDFLPKLEFKMHTKIIGDDTNSSIYSGVNRGVISEVETIINDFRKEINDLFVIVTGGDTFFFEKELKSSIFADQELLLKGLNQILEYNE
tara:strand:- start:51551 stop:52255 length:705 start_codon:yes stop_codon:yes gene_type:complete